MDFAFSQSESKESKKIQKYLDLACELRKLWNMKVKVIPIVVGAVETTPLKSGEGTGATGNQ